MNNHYEVYGFRHFESQLANGSRRCGYFKLKLYIGDNDWIEIDSLRLVCKEGEYWIMPPAEKNTKKEDDWRDVVRFSDGVKKEIANKAMKLYTTICNAELTVA